MDGFKGIVRSNADGFMTIAGAPDSRALAFARLSNRSALQTILNCPEPVSDDALLVAAWDLWGEAMTDQLHGRYAFLVLDADRRNAFVAVDRFASIPLHYHDAHGALTISTYLRDLADDPTLRGGMNRRMVADYLLSIGDGPALGNQTFFEDIKRVPGGHYLTFDGSVSRLHHRRRPEHRESTMDPDEAVAQFRDLLSRAILAAAEEDEACVSLSGGLDSSTIAILAKEAWGSLPAIHFHSQQDDETSWVQPVVDGGGLQLETVGCDGFMDSADGMLKALAEPWAYDNVHHDYLMLKQSKELGRSTLLSGYYGDVTVCESLDYMKPLADDGEWETLHAACVTAATIQGRPPESFLPYLAGDRFESLAAAGSWRTLWSDLRTVARLFGIPFGSLFWHCFLRPMTPTPLRRTYRIIRGTDRPVWWEMNRQLNREFATIMELNERAKRIKMAWTTPLKDARATHENLLYHDSTALTLAHLFALSRATGVQCAHPFMDDALIDFCLDLPRDLHGRDGWDRWITREAMVDRLPDAVRLRTERTNYAATSMAELRHDADAIDAFLEDWPPALSEFVNRDAFVRDWNWLKEETELSPSLIAAGRRVRRATLLGKWLVAYG